MNIETLAPAGFILFITVVVVNLLVMPMKKKDPVYGLTS